MKFYAAGCRKQPPARKEGLTIHGATQAKTSANILVAGHAGCGKTTLTEALLYMSGASERMGRVEDATTASDLTLTEIRRKASLNSSVVPVEYEASSTT